MTFAFDTQASPAQVFALIGDLTRHGEWSPQEYEVARVDDGPVRVGSRYRTQGRRGARKGVLRDNDVVVVAYEPPARFAIEAVESAGTYRTTFVVTPTPTGSRVERIVEPPTFGVVAFIRHDLLRPVTRAYVGKNMQALQDHLAKTTS